MHHDLSTKYVDACPVRKERLATPQMTEKRLGWECEGRNLAVNQQGLFQYQSRFSRDPIGAS
jgi:hypothetical protein